MKSDDEIHKDFANILWSDYGRETTYPEKRPLLAHYTSMQVLENIVATNEIWFSNPLLMNDVEELRFGMIEGNRLFRGSNLILKACKDREKYVSLISSFDFYFKKFDLEHALDTYVFCMSEHDPGNTDGVLSMWRGYGGDGSGAALIFNTDKLIYQPGNSHLILSDVHYASNDERIKWIEDKIISFSKLLSEYNIPENKMYIPAYCFYERLILFSLFTKHKGFSEEREWRAVYRKEHDAEKKLVPMLHYNISGKGVELKLKLNVNKISELYDRGYTLEDFIENLILGPTTSSALSKAAVCRMLQKSNKNKLVKKLIASSTPYRPN